MSEGRGEDTKLAIIDVQKAQVAHRTSEAEKSQDYNPAINSEKGLLAYETDAAKTHNELSYGRWKDSRKLQGSQCLANFPGE